MFTAGYKVLSTPALNERDSGFITAVSENTYFFNNIFRKKVGYLTRKYLQDRINY
jgi:hypothetical protein